MQKEAKITAFKKAFTAAFPHTLPVLIGFLFLGIAYGVLMQSVGYGVFWAVLMSILAFAGSMQFVAITLLTTTFNPIAAFLLSIMVNARHLFYGISMLKKYSGLGKLKYLLIFLLCDETFSISQSVELPENINRKYFYLSVSLLDYSYWVFGTFFGGVLGRFIKFNTKGLDFVLTALFVVLFLESWKNKNNRISCIIGVGGTALCLMLFGANNFIIPSMMVILLALLGWRKKICF